MKSTNLVLDLQALNFLHGLKLRIALFGGSFDPVHEGHMLLAHQALQRYNFDYVIFIVANQNPYKQSASKDIFIRARAVKNLSDHPKILVSTIEHDLGCFYSSDTIQYFVKNFPSCHFTWIMGIDVFLTFGKWRFKDYIRSACDIIVFDRPINNRLVNIYSLDGANFFRPLDKTKTHPIMLYRGKLRDISSTSIKLNQEIK